MTVDVAARVQVAASIGPGESNAEGRSISCGRPLKRSLAVVEQAGRARRARIRGTHQPHAGRCSHGRADIDRKVSESAAAAGAPGQPCLTCATARLSLAHDEGTGDCGQSRSYTNALVRVIALRRHRRRRGVADSPAARQDRERGAREPGALSARL